MRIRRGPTVAVRSRGLPQPERAAFEADALASLDSLYRTARRLTRVAGRRRRSRAGHISEGISGGGQFEPGTNLRAWLFTILHNTARNRVRDRARDAVTVDSDAVERALEQPHRSGTRCRRRPKRCCCATRSRRTCRPRSTSCRTQFREAVWLRDVEEFSYAEIADMLVDSGRHGDVAHLARPRICEAARRRQRQSSARSTVAASSAVGGRGLHDGD